MPTAGSERITRSPSGLTNTRQRPVRPPATTVSASSQPRAVEAARKKAPSSSSPTCPSRAARPPAWAKCAAVFADEPPGARVGARPRIARAPS